MIDHKRRWVYIFDFSLNSSPEDAPSIGMHEAMLKVRKVFKDGEAYKMYRENTQATRISDMKIDDKNKVVKLLIQHADKNASDPVFANLQSGELRQEEKLSGEGVAVSAHMIIAIDPVDSAGNQYVALLEEVPGITRSHLKPFLTAIFKEAFINETFTDPDTNKSKQYRPMAELSSHPDQTLGEILDGKKLQTISFTGYEKVTGFDEESYLRPVEHALKFKVLQEPSNVVSWLKTLKEKYIGKGYADMRVFYKDPTRAMLKAQGSVKIEKKQDAATALFTRQEEITLDSPLAQCESKLVDEMCVKMIKVLSETIQMMKSKKKK